MSYVPSAKANQSQTVYCIQLPQSEYVGVTTSLVRRFQEHKEDKNAIGILASISVLGRREAEGLEATLHQLQKQGWKASEILCTELYDLHSLWFHSGCKGYPKHLRQKPQLSF